MLECCVCCKRYDRRMCGDGDECCNGIGALQEVHIKIYLLQWMEQENIYTLISYLP
jgi:hypothetical protein